MAFRLGVAAPFGKATGAANDRLARRYAWQVPFLVDLGAKVSESIYVGGYLGFGFGDEGNSRRVDAYCDDNDDDLENDVSCISYTARIGAQVQYSFQPGAAVNPWVGYGIGYELAETTINDRINGRSEKVSMGGLEIMKLSFGVDFRSSRVAGIGPFAEASLGRYSRTKTSINGQNTYNGEVDDPATHGWAMVGLRFVLFP
jgi:hypothetical protein